MNRQEMAKKLILNDIKEILNTYYLCSKETCIHFMLGGFLYFATIISGAIDWCGKAGIIVNNFVDKSLIDKLRTKVKLYSGDSIISLDEQKNIMSNIIEIEKQYWLDEQEKSGKWCPKFLIPDIGSYKVNGHYIGNTLEYAYEFSPLNPDKKPILTALGGTTPEDTLSYRISVEIGQTMQSLYSNMTNRKYILYKKEVNDIAVIDDDFRMSNRCYFKNENAIYAFNLCCRINYLLELFLMLCPKESFLAFRMIYITFYHIKDDLNNLELDFVHYNMPYRDKEFRNAMAHYSLYGKIEDSEINDNVIGYGLIEKFFGKSFETINDAVIDELRKTRDSIEQYVKI